MSPVLHLEIVPIEASYGGLEFFREFDDCFTFCLAQKTWRACYSRSIAILWPGNGSGKPAPEPLLLLDVSSGMVGSDTVAQAAVIRLLPGSLPAVNGWRLAMNARLDEAIESIREEEVQFESWFLFNWDDQDYLFAYMRRASIPQNKSGSTLPIDAVHRDFKKCWDRSLRVQCELLSSGDSASEFE